MKHILIVDDNKTNLSIAKSVLSNKYKITAVISGTHALKFLEKKDCDIILLDIDMPDMNGFEVYEKIRSDDKINDIPVIFLTAQNDVDTEIRCFEAGAMDFIAKPFVPAVMLSRVERILELEDMRQKLTDKLNKKIEEVKDIKSKSHMDALTGLWNRDYFEDSVNEIINNGGFGAMFMVDMDNFKLINDTYGHIEGDNTLKMFADTIRKFLTESDIACRIGGDEFIMFINEVTSKSLLSNLAQDIITDICLKITEKNFETNTSVSIGISIVPEDGTDFITAYNSADKALYYVKQNGKNHYHFFSEEKMAENMRSSTLVDLKYLREMMLRTDSNQGVYQLDMESFHHVYNFIRRFVERSENNVQTVLFTVHYDSGADQAEVDTALEMLEHAIYVSLRRTDISTRYSNKQIIVILMDSNSENGDMVARRIITCFEKLFISERVSISYDIAKLEGRI